MYTLGINAAYHDPAACLVRDGEVLAAAEEERFTHVKHGKRPVPFSTWELPFHAIDYCLREAGITLTDVDHVAYSFDPELLLDRSDEHASISLPLQPSAPARGTGQLALGPAVSVLHRQRAAPACRRRPAPSAGALSRRHGRRPVSLALRRAPPGPRRQRFHASPFRRAPC